MLFNYNEIISIYKNNYFLKKALMEKKIYKVDRGIYSDGLNNFTKYELLLKKYPKSFLVHDSALFYIGFIKKEPAKVHLGTSRNALRIKDSNVIQHFYKNLHINQLNTKYHTFNNILSNNNLISYTSENQNTIKLFNYNALLYDFIRNKSKINENTFNEILDKFKNTSYLINFSQNDFEYNLIHEKVFDYDLIDDLLWELQSISWDNEFKNDFY